MCDIGIKNSVKTFTVLGINPKQNTNNNITVSKYEKLKRSSIEVAFKKQLIGFKICVHGSPSRKSEFFRGKIVPKFPKFNLCCQSNEKIGSFSF